MVNGENRINWIVGLKGIICLLIFTHHFLLAFFPSSYYGDAGMSHFKYDVQFASSPLSFIVNGNFLVHIFCLLSGYIISVKFLKKLDNEKMSKSLIKRYFQLGLNIFFIGILVWLLFKFNLFNNSYISEITKSPWLASYYTNKISFKNMFVSSFVNTIFIGDDLVSNAFWMLKYIFIGTFLNCVLSVISVNKNKKILILYFCLLLIFIYLQSYLACFVIGFILDYIENQININCSNKLFCILGIILIIIGCFLGGYPTGASPNNIYLKFHGNYFVYHLIGSTFLIIGILLCKCIQKFFSKGIFLEFGKISFEIYLIHIPLIFSFSMFIFKFLITRLNYIQSSIFTYFFSVIVLLFLAILYNSYISKFIKKIENGIIKFFEKK